MAHPIPTALFCGEIFYIGECLSRDSNIPISCAPRLTDAELHVCDAIITHLQRNLTTTDLLAMLVNTFNIATPAEFERRLSDIINDSLAADQEHRHDANHKPEYWFRIANTYSKLFVLEAVQEWCANEACQDAIEMAWGCYDTAVKYAEKIDADSHKKNLVGFLNKHLRDCGIAVETLIQQAVVPERG